VLLRIDWGTHGKLEEHTENIIGNLVGTIYGNMVGTPKSPKFSKTKPSPQKEKN
jgi:hypothetical protein